jgi:hypothetical protein
MADDFEGPCQACGGTLTVTTDDGQIPCPICAASTATRREPKPFDEYYCDEPASNFKRLLHQQEKGAIEIGVSDTGRIYLIPHDPRTPLTDDDIEALIAGLQHALKEARKIRLTLDPHPGMATLAEIEAWEKRNPRQAPAADPADVAAAWKAETIRRFDCNDEEIEAMEKRVAAKLAGK